MRSARVPQQAADDILVTLQGRDKPKKNEEYGDFNRRINHPVFSKGSFLDTLSRKETYSPRVDVNESQLPHTVTLLL